MDLEKYKKLQEDLAKKIILKDSFKNYSIVAGFDIIYKNNEALCSGVIIDKSFKIVEVVQHKSKPLFPYIPGFLAFREGPLIIETFRLFKNKPDILMLKGHGTLHFRGAGLASYVGIVLDLPTIGIAKELLFPIKENCNF
ncbi:endonuclease V [Candidatus Woesearchaeota archaeon]|nr:endonuclease V [Candidatus Woesearchaeota archaeon]